MGRKAAKRADKTILLDVFCMGPKYRIRMGFRSIKLMTWEKSPKFCLHFIPKTTVISRRNDYF